MLQATAVIETFETLRERARETGPKRVAECLCAALRSSVGWIAPVVVFPGEEELVALAEGARRVLDGEEAPRLLEEAGTLVVASA